MFVCLHDLFAPFFVGISKSLSKKILNVLCGLLYSTVQYCDFKNMTRAVFIPNQKFVLWALNFTSRQFAPYY